MTSYLANSNYPAPIIFAANQQATGPGNIVDIAACTTSRIPPVIIATLGVMTVLVEGSHDAVNWVDYSGGGFTSGFSKDLIQGIRFWRTRISAYTSGALNASVGAVPDASGRVLIPNLLQVTNNVPTQSG